MRICRGLRLLGAAGVLLGVMVVTMAPANQTPEKITGSQPEWDSSNDAFVLSFEVQRDALFPPPTRDFTIETTVIDTTLEVFVDGRRVALLEPDPHPVEARPGALQTQDRYVPIAPQRVPWDRNGGTITGEVVVRIHAQLVWENPNRPPSPATFTEWGLLLV